MKLFLAVLLFVVLALPATAQAQTKCEGPTELCTQILQLQSEIEAHKKLTADAQTAKNADDVKVASYQEEQKTREQKMLKFFGFMSGLAVVLKILVSLLTTWKNNLFSSDRGKAWIRVSILVLTLAVFLATNLGFGIPWWQALILAAGGPLSVFLHEMAKLVPVIRGKAKLPDDQTSSGDSPQTTP